jgi:hypothetical protein
MAQMAFQTIKNPLSFQAFALVCAVKDVVCAHRKVSYWSWKRDPSSSVNEVRPPRGSFQMEHKSNGRRHPFTTPGDLFLQLRAAPAEKEHTMMPA